MLFDGVQTWKVLGLGRSTNMDENNWGHNNEKSWDREFDWISELKGGNQTWVHIDGGIGGDQIGAASRLGQSLLRCQFKIGFGDFAMGVCVCMWQTQGCHRCITANGGTRELVHVHIPIVYCVVAVYEGSHIPPHIVLEASWWPSPTGASRISSTSCVSLLVRLYASQQKILRSLCTPLERSM